MALTRALKGLLPHGQGKGTLGTHWQRSGKKPDPRDSAACCSHEHSKSHLNTTCLPSNSHFTSSSFVIQRQGKKKKTFARDRQDIQGWVFLPTQDSCSVKYLSDDSSQRACARLLSLPT